MNEQIKIILIIIVSVSIFGLLIFVYVKNYMKSKIDRLLKVKKIKKKLIAFLNIARALLVSNTSLNSYSLYGK